jgi:hypothetical protein
MARESTSSSSPAASTIGQGRITIDGNDLRTFAVEDLCSRISVIFQQRCTTALLSRRTWAWRLPKRRASGPASTPPPLRRRPPAIWSHGYLGCDVARTWFAGGKELSVASGSESLWHALSSVRLDSPPRRANERDGSWAEGDREA